MRGSISFLILLACLCFHSVAPSPAHAQDFAELVGGLTERSFSKKQKTVEAIAASGHPQSINILNALAKNRLYYSKADKTVFIVTRASGGFAAKDAISGADKGVMEKSALKKIRTNNRLRRAIRAALGGLTLLSKDADKRLNAAQTIFKSRDENILPTLQKAIKQEQRADIKRVMQNAEAAILINSDAAEAQKIAAIRHLRNVGGNDVLALLSPLTNSENKQIAQTAQTAVKAIKNEQAIWNSMQNVVYGLSLGSVLLLAAIGLAITFGVMGVINMAHGEMVMIGAYVTFMVQDIIRTSAPGLFDYSLLIALPLAFLIAGLIGMAMERGIIRFLYGRPLETLLATWGVSLILQQAVRTIFGPNNREVGNPSWMSGSVDLGHLTLTWNRLYIIIFALCVFGALYALMRRTTFGLQMRAVVQNRHMASSMGIRTKWVDALTFGLGSGIAGIAGVALSQIDNVNPNLGQSYIVDSFMVVVFGGVGNLWGTLVGAFSLGVANKFLEPYAGAVLGKILVLVFIILFIQKRPRGLFALKGRSVET